MCMRAVEIAGGRPLPHLSFDFDSSIMVSKLTANRTGAVDDRESTCAPVRQGIFIVLLFFFYTRRCGDRKARHVRKISSIVRSGDRACLVYLS